MKKFFGLLALIVALNFSAVEASLESVTDNAGILKPTEVELLNQMIAEVEQTHKIKIGVVFVKSLEGRNIVKAADDLLDQNFNNGMNGSILLLVDMSGRKYEISTNSRMSERITNSDGISFLKEKFKSSLSAGNYFVAVNNFVDGVGELMTYYETNGKAYGNQNLTGFDQTSAGIDPVTAVLAVVMAIFFGVMIRSSLIGSMSNVHHAMEATDYLKRNTVKFTEKRDTFLFKNVKRRMRSGGGKRGGGGHGGGHGGGGGSF